MVEKDITRNEIYLDYSLDGVNYVNVLTYEAAAGRWVGVKHGIFCCNEPGTAEAKAQCEENGQGVLFNYFKVEKL